MKPITLHPIEEADLAQLAAWRNRPALQQRTREYRPLTMADQRRWYARISRPDTRDHMRLALSDLIDHVSDEFSPVAVVGLCHWEPRDRTAEISFYATPHAPARQGYTYAAVVAMCRWGFDTLDLAKIWAEVYAFNVAGEALLTKVGFTREGQWRQHVFRYGERHDVISMGLLADEFTVPEDA